MGNRHELDGEGLDFAGGKVLLWNLTVPRVVMEVQSGSGVAQVMVPSVWDLPDVHRHAAECVRVNVLQEVGVLSLPAVPCSCGGVDLSVVTVLPCWP